LSYAGGGVVVGANVGGVLVAGALPQSLNIFSYLTNIF
jgi:hypothetical protein